MRVLWNELSPKDRFVAKVVRPLSYAELGYLTQLYLPLIGMESYTLYHILMHETDEHSGASGEGTHRMLMLATSLTLDKLLEARERLEAMSLLEVRRKESRDKDYYFEYLIKPPLSPAQFFREELWTVMLLNKIEQPRMEHLRRMYAERRGPADEEYPYEENLTKSFFEVFHTLSPSEVSIRQGSETDRFLRRMQDQYPLPALQTDYEPEVAATLDLSFVRLHLPADISPGQVLTPENIEFLYKLQHFYHMSSWQLGQELRDWTLYDQMTGSLDREALRRRCREKYLDGVLTRIASSHTANEFIGAGKVPEPGSPGFAKVCRQMSPLAMLETVVGGRISKAYLERAEGLVFADGLPSEVANALLLYALRETRLELPRSFVETVRDSWKAKQIRTVDEAVATILEREAGRTEKPRPTTRKEPSAAGGNRRNGRPVLQDKLPASVIRQLEREQSADSDPQPARTRKRKTIMDDPELKALYESLHNPRKEGE